MKPIVDIIGEVVESLSQTIEVNSVVKTGDSYEFAVDKTYWARPKSQQSLATKVTIGVTEYDIESMVYNTSITVVSTTNLSNTTELTLSAPEYINGTRSATNRERAGSSMTSCPFVWLVEPFVAVESTDVMSIIASQPDLTVVFLDNMRQDDWNTADHYEKVIVPMQELAEAFKAKLRTNRSTFGKITRWDSVSRAIYGSEGANGAISSILNEKTSGVEVRFTVEILKSFNTCN